MGYYDQAKHSYNGVTVGLTPIDIQKKGWGINENIERHRGNNYFRLNIKEKIDELKILITTYHDKPVLDYEDYNFYTQQYKYKLNPDASIHTIVVEADVVNGPRNCNSRVHKALVEWIKNNNGSLSFTKNWNDNQWNFYSMNNSKFMIGIAKMDRDSDEIKLAFYTAN